EDLTEPVVALGRRHPVVGGAGVVLLAGTDEREVLGPGDVVRRAPVEVAAGQLVLIERQELASPDGGLGEAGPLRLGTVAPDDVVGSAEPRDVVHPASDGLAPAHGRLEITVPRRRGSGQCLRRGRGGRWGAMILGAG